MEPKIALPPIHIVETKAITIEADHELTQMLDRYRAFYRDAYGADVDEAMLIREMTKRFMESDKEFQRYGKKKRRTKRTAPPKVGSRSTASPSQLPLRSE